MRKATLVVAPGLDGSALYFRAVASHLLDQVDIRYIDASGFWGERVPSSSVEAMSRSYIDALDKVPADTALCIVGWSFASMIAYHMAWLLELSRPVCATIIDPLWPSTVDLRGDGSVGLIQRSDQPEDEESLARNRDFTRFPNRELYNACRIAAARYRPRMLVSRTLFVFASHRSRSAACSAERLLSSAPNHAAVCVEGDHYGIISGEGARLISQHILALMSRHCTQVT